MPQTPTPPTAHGVTHTRPIIARGQHFNAANEPMQEPTEEELQQADVDRLRTQQSRERARLSELTQWEIACARVQGVVS